MVPQCLSPQSNSLHVLVRRASPTLHRARAGFGRRPSPTTVTHSHATRFTRYMYEGAPRCVCVCVCVLIGILYERVCVSLQRSRRRRAAVSHLSPKEQWADMHARRVFPLCGGRRRHPTSPAGTTLRRQRQQTAGVTCLRGFAHVPRPFGFRRRPLAPAWSTFLHYMTRGPWTAATPIARGRCTNLWCSRRHGVALSTSSVAHPSSPLPMGAVRAMALPLPGTDLQRLLACEWQHGVRGHNAAATLRPAGSVASIQWLAPRPRWPRSASHLATQPARTRWRLRFALARSMRLVLSL